MAALRQSWMAQLGMLRKPGAPAGAKTDAGTSSAQPALQPSPGPEPATAAPAEAAPAAPPADADAGARARAAAAAALAAAKGAASATAAAQHGRVTVTETRRFAGQDVQARMRPAPSLGRIRGNDVLTGAPKRESQAQREGDGGGAACAAWDFGSPAAHPYCDPPCWSSAADAPRAHCGSCAGRRSGDAAACRGEMRRSSRHTLGALSRSRRAPCR